MIKMDKIGYQEIPLLSAMDIECRVQQVRQSYDKKTVEAVLLLYKDARCDMKYLDLLYGVTGWKRKHSLIGDRLYCTVEIWDNEKQQWVSKEDVGTESNAEKEKGQASDAFKRACFNIGIGRELYTAPFIKIALKEREYTADGGRYRTYATFSVKEIEYDKERQISKLVIVDRFGNQRYIYQKERTAASEKLTAREQLIRKLREQGIDLNQYARAHNLTSETTAAEFERLLAQLSAKEQNRRNME